MAENEVRHVVAWRRPVQWATCVALWLVFAIAVALPELELPLRAIAPFGFAAALFRTGVLAAESRQAAAPRWLVGLTLCVDAVLLTELLDITGGPFNPFVVIYAVDVWLAMIAVSTAWGVAVALVAGGSFAWLVVDHIRAGLAEHHRLNDFPTHLFTMWYVGSSIAELVAHYVGHARETLAARQRELEQARERAVRSERLASLTTLAAGAAHELSTPLATVAVAARELERTARAADAKLADDLMADVRLIQGAVQRSRSILDGMSGRASGGGLAGEPMTAGAIAELACDGLPAPRRARLQLDIDDANGCRITAGADVARALSSLIKNAFDADRQEHVHLKAAATGSTLRFEVRDHGHGMSPEVRRRAGEPFFTTKPAGEGLGLGLFLARTVAEQLGGSLRFEGTSGTVAILEIPASVQ